ncbi:hypothetical protein XENOCAPTIV_012751, partial [Xenoophorus captivus]
LLPGARPSSEGKRKRNKSVSNMEKASIEPPEEEEEEKPIVNGNSIAVTPGQNPTASTDAKEFLKHIYLFRVAFGERTAGQKMKFWISYHNELKQGDVRPQSNPVEAPAEVPQEDGQSPKTVVPKPEENDQLGPLPDNWEMAYTEKGEVYFIE